MNTAIDKLAIDPRQGLAVRERDICVRISFGKCILQLDDFAPRQPTGTANWTRQDLFDRA